MFNKEMYNLGSQRSVIRELFEYGKTLAREMGQEAVFDFSLGNPSVPAPKEVETAALDALKQAYVHGYTSAQGDLSVRIAVANNINKRFNVGITADGIYMTAGAAAALCIVLTALNEGTDEFITFAPYFPEYGVFVKSAGGKLLVAPHKDDFSPELNGFRALINKNTKAIIVNSPNNPSGAVYSEEDIEGICGILREKSAEYGHPIFLISDEPYREIVYDGAHVPYLMNYYDNTVVCYSFSKSLSLPGERIGYIAVSPKCIEKLAISAAIAGAGRALGYVCAPSLFQKVIEKCLDAEVNVAAYKKNRDILYNGLNEIGFDCVLPKGAFYLLVKSPLESGRALSDAAKKLGILIVPGDGFGAPNYARIAYCVDYEMIKRSLPVFKKLWDTMKRTAQD